MGLFVLCWLAFSWPWLTGSIVIPWDAAAHFVPQVQFMAASFARGEWPFWTPYVFSGHPQIADPQSMIFSPPMLVLAVLNEAPSLRAVDTAVLLTILFGGIGVLLLARDWRWHPAGGLIAALGFAFGGAMAWRLQHFGQVLSLAYLPFALLLLQRALQPLADAEPGARLLYGLGAGLVAGFIAAGRDQVGLLCLYLLAGYVVWHWLSAPAPLSAVRRTLAPLAAGATAGLIVAGAPLVLTALLAADSNRPVIDYAGAGAGSLHPALLLTTLTPHLFGAAGPMADYWGPPSFAWQGTGLFIAQNVGQLYIGAVPLLLLLIGAMWGVLWEREIRFFTVAAVVSLVYALGWYTPAFRLMYEILPGVDLYRRPADAVFLIGALASVLAGYATHRLFTWSLSPPALWQRAVAAGLVAAAFVLALLLAVAFDRVEAAGRPLLVAAVWFAAAAALIAAAAWLNPIRPRVALLILVIPTALDLAINNGPNGSSAMAPSELEMLEPGTRNPTIALLKDKLAATASDTRRDRVELAGLGFHWPNASLTHGLEQTLGYNPLRLRDYAAATGAEDTVGLPDQRKFTALFPSYRSRLSDLLGLRFIATGVPIEEIDKRLKPGELPLLARTPDGYVYENPRALPRVLFASSAIAADFGRLIATGAWPELDPTDTVMLEGADDRTQRRPGTARIVRYRNTEVMIEADSPDGGWVVLNDVWHSWWRAEVDGVPVPLLRANVLFRAVAVPAGLHKVNMTFKPFAGAIWDVGGYLGAPRQ